MPNETKAEWPAWYSSPTGAETAIFNKPEDVPAGWTTGSEQKTVSGNAVKSAPKATPAPKATLLRPWKPQAAPLDL